MDDIEDSDDLQANSSNENYDHLSDLSLDTSDTNGRKKKVYKKRTVNIEREDTDQPEKESEFSNHLKTLLDQVLNSCRYGSTSEGDNEFSSNTDSESCFEINADETDKGVETDGAVLLKPLPVIERQGKLSHVTLQLTYRRVFQELKYAKVVAGYSNKQIFAMLDQMKFFGDPDVAFTMLAQRYVAAGYVTKDKELTYKKLKGLLKLIPKINISHRNYVEGSMYYVLAAFYMGDRIGKAWKYIQKAKAEMKHVEPSSWSALVLEREANVLIACGDMRPAAKHKYLCTAFESYRLAREHYVNNPCNSEEHIMYNEAKYMLQMLYLRLEMPLPYVVVTLKDRNIIDKHAKECSLSWRELKQTEMILQKIKNFGFKFSEEYRYHHLYYVRTAEIYLEMRKAQFYLKQGNAEFGLKYIHRGISLCNNWGEEYCHDQVLMDTILVRNRIGRVLASIQDKICNLLVEGLNRPLHTKPNVDSDVQV